MIIKTWRMGVATSVALAVLFAYSVPLRALPTAKAISKVPASAAVPQTDDDDDDLSGGALAVLLLAIGGAVAGVLYLSPDSGQSGKHSPSLDIKKTDSNTIQITMDRSAGTDKRIHTEWTANIDQSSRQIKLTLNRTGSAGNRTQLEWTGKADGRFYPVKGDPTTDEMSYTAKGRMLVFTAKKAGRVTETSEIVAAANGRSFTMSTKRSNSRGQNASTKAVYNRRQ